MAETESRSCNKFNFFRIVTIKKEFGEGPLKLSIFSLKTEILLQFLRLGSKLFHSIIADRKKAVFQKIVLCLNKGNIAHSSCRIWCSSYK